MAEPIYVSQTFEPEDFASALDWFRARSADASAAGGTWPRYTANRGGLLIEVWAVRPDDEGAQRWFMER